MKWFVFGCENKYLGYVFWKIFTISVKIFWECSSQKEIRKLCILGWRRWIDLRQGRNPFQVHQVSTHNARWVSGSAAKIKASTRYSDWWIKIRLYHVVFRAKSVLKNGTFLGLFLRISPAAERKWRVRKGTPYRILGS